MPFYIVIMFTKHKIKVNIDTFLAQQAKTTQTYTDAHEKLCIKFCILFDFILLLYPNTSLQ